MRALFLVLLCGASSFGQWLNQNGMVDPMAQPAGIPSVNPNASTDSNTPSVPGEVITAFHVVLDDGGPPVRKPDIVSRSCNSYSMKANGVATLVAPSWVGHCSATISLPGFQSVRVETTLVHRPITLVLRRIGAEPSTMAAGPVSVAMLRMPPSAHKAYAEGEAAMGLGRLAEAAAFFRKTVSEYPTHALAWDELGLALDKLNLRDEAAAAWRKALEADPSLTRACMHLAVVAIRDARYTDAARYTECAVRSPEAATAAAWYLDAAASFSLDRFPRAESSARQAIRLDQTQQFPRAEFILGMALAQLNDTADAIEHLRRYLSLEPTGEFARAARKRLNDLESRAGVQRP
ncbi:MAG TPA: tetratricopeptide repeat protein [Bryobacteraceae bacterium]|nr:tetratricopeptide repeat protein [Bryobacteraceae bacterium]